MLFILDNGHGGLINGVPQTRGKRSPNWDKGILYEGVSNRLIVDRVLNKLAHDEIYAVKLVPENEDITLRERVKRVNTIAKQQPSVLISLHSDAWTTPHAHGWSAYTTHGETKSDAVASILYKYAKEAGLYLRDDYSDGDADKEANFYILKNTSCPAVLVENLFMTNPDDYKFLMSDEGREVLVNIIYDTIKYILKHGLE